MQTVEERKEITEYWESSIDLGREPGEGAIQFAKQFIQSQADAIPILQRLLDGEIHDATDNRIKRCAYCQYYWRDDSLRNTKKTCCDDCHTAKKSIQKRQQRERQDLINPKPRKRKLIDDYIWWLEYPLWLDEYSMLKIGWKFEVPHTMKTINSIEAKNHIYGDGNRKTSIKKAEY
ncbi:hypothetical protein [Virgibacillus necropolis]|uniref:Uncharacterized protein n=1 Tax=Virgibacillus necropolis TaxID=163877 RepID=A0A221MGS4_9BACI|nr:hypothetical protein [Virgibacillus necropolis]ASN06847.1 hypothetical protein CFK40_18380 [Virgibacillus necropolis]